MIYKSDTCFSKHDNSPLTTYSSEEEAIGGADYANERYGNNLRPYQCSKCGEWHLSPADRITRSTTCRFCRDGNNNLKELYFSNKEANKRADIIYEERGLSLNVYKCPHGEGWHLTKG